MGAYAGWHANTQSSTSGVVIRTLTVDLRRIVSCVATYLDARHVAQVPSGVYWPDASDYPLDPVASLATGSEDNRDAALVKDAIRSIPRQPVGPVDLNPIERYWLGLRGQWLVFVRAILIRGTEKLCGVSSGSLTNKYRRSAPNGAVDVCGT